jgi:hypothetical protein
MNENLKATAVLGILSVLFISLAIGFRLHLWGQVHPAQELPQVDPSFLDTNSVRQSVEQILRDGGDPSDYDCYFCHEEDKPPALTFDTNNIIILPEEHSDLVMRHGRRNRNDNCYNCHDRQLLTKLKTRDGQQLELHESTQLCASCHGPTHRDWELGVHGRRTGYWNQELGGMARLGCASCHDPHAPEFPSLEPAPAPYSHSAKSETHSEEGNH